MLIYLVRRIFYAAPVALGVALLVFMLVHIAPGDFILGDRDGVLVIPQSIAADVVSKAEEVVQTENLVRKSILQGMHPVDAFRKFGRF